MHIAVDARAGLAYRGTGIGTYTSQLLKQLLTGNEDKVALLLPGGEWVEAAGDAAALLAHCGQKRPDFWEGVGPVATPPPEGVEVYLVPQNGLGLPAPGVYEAPLVVTVHDLIPWVLPQTCSRTFLRRALAEIPRAVEEARLVLTVSHHSKRDLQRYLGVPESRLVVIPEAPDERLTLLDPDLCRARVARRYGLTEPFILNVGGFSRRKNLSRLVQAFAAFHRRSGLPHRLVLVGRPGGGSYAQCRELAERLGVGDLVVFPGFVAAEDLPSLYNAANLFVFPSLYEGFGLPPLEAMACGVPVIAADTSSLPEVVGGAARLVDPLDPEGLARTMAEVLADRVEAERLSQAGLARSREFSWRRTATLTRLALERAAFGLA